MVHIARAVLDRSHWNDSGLKPSQFNTFLGSEDTGVGYNILYRSIVRLPRVAFDYLCNPSDDINVNASHAFPQQWTDALSSSRFLIDCSTGEVDLIRLRYNESLHSAGFLSLTLLPTIWCNLDCPYCFEFKKPLFMSEEVERGIVEWVRREFSHKRKIHIAWFGGEPLPQCCINF